MMDEEYLQGIPQNKIHFKKILLKSDIEPEIFRKYYKGVKYKTSWGRAFDHFDHISAKSSTLIKFFDIFQ